MSSYDHHVIRTGLLSVASGDGEAADTYNYLNVNNNASDPKVDISGFTLLEAELLVASNPTGGATTPTLDCVIQASNDGSTWWDLIAFTQIADVAPTAAEHKIADRTTAALGRYHRAKFTAGAASGTATYAPRLTLTYNRR